MQFERIITTLIIISKNLWGFAEKSLILYYGLFAINTV